MKASQLIAVLLALLAVATIIVLAVLTGIFHQRSLAAKDKYVYDKQVHEALYSDVSGMNIRDHLYHFTEELGWKLAGTKAEKDAALYIKKQFEKNGLSGVQVRSVGEAEGFWVLDDKLYLEVI